MIERAPHRLEQGFTSRRLLRLGTKILAGGFIATNCLATQRAAAGMHYPAWLSGRLIGRVYQPFAWWGWMRSWPDGGVRIGSRIVALAPLWRSCEHLAVYPVLGFGILGALIAVLLNRRQAPADLHGSACWADTTEIKKAELL
jgi:hypothetical protein